jgi:lipoprotein NlpD
MTLPAASRRPHLLRWVLPLVVAAAIAGCASRGGQAPVEDRAVGARTPAPVANPSGTPTTGAPSTPAPAGTAAEPGQRPATYTVKPGDTLIHIGLDVGQPWRDIARWNNIDNPNRIKVGQVLQVAPPPAETAAVTRPVVPPGRVATEAATASPAASAPAPARAATTTTTTTTTAAPAPSSALPPPPTPPARRARTACRPRSATPGRRRRRASSARPARS